MFQREAFLLSYTVGNASCEAVQTKTSMHHLKVERLPPPSHLQYYWFIHMQI